MITPLHGVALHIQVHEFAQNRIGDGVLLRIRVYVIHKSQRYWILTVAADTQR